MVTIRLARTGKKQQPFYHVIVADSRNKRDGQFIERLGFCNPVAKGQEASVKVDLERVDYWLERGAQPSASARDLIRKARKGAVAEAPVA